MYLIIGIIVIIAVYVVITYNGFVSLKNRARNAWADIDVQLKRRYDLIPNLVTTVKGYAEHEKSVLENVTRLRTQAMGIQNTDERSGAETQLSGAIKSLFAVAESYPDLRADQNFRDLQRQLTEIEDQIQYARRYYNAVVRDLNTKREMFPSSIIANMSGVSSLPYFQVGDDERENVQVKIDE